MVYLDIVRSKNKDNSEHNYPYFLASRIFLNQYGAVWASGESNLLDAQNVCKLNYTNHHTSGVRPVISISESNLAKYLD